ncbi:MAG TPA: patatin-like phospholipase family protein [Archangium sp.]|uniref:patatin-like phospholipase family protein n=1 Tax=Archangium sp. TaxID=1872627 RepID=UPI002E367C45|nr:patatin-like phospholipase family protein [Archangium sp.]HEX5752391.1 patatin-like phospholipase family protein [Archangium sp.]
MSSPNLHIASSHFGSGVVLFVALGILAVPRTAEAQMTASEAATFYDAFLGQPAKSCADLRAYPGKVPSFRSELCVGAANTAPINLDAYLKDRVPKVALKTKALINGGGVSMGSYQAGRLQGLINEARVEVLDKLFDAAVLATDPSELAKVDERLNAVLAGTDWANLGFTQVAGASAGGMNALGFAIEVCRDTLLPTFAPKSTTPSFLDKTDSVLRRMWMDVGFEESDPDSWVGGAALLRPGKLPEDAARADKNAVFSAEPLDQVISKVTQFFESDPKRAAPVPLRAGCHMGASITLTSLKPVEVNLKGEEDGSFLSVTLPVMVELRTTSTTPPHFEVKAYDDGNESIMTVDGNAEAFLKLVRATGALPPALPMLTLCEDSLAGPIQFGGTRYTVGACDLEDWEKAVQAKEGNWLRPWKKPKRGGVRGELSLIDGGLFNNNPLDLVLDRTPLDQKSPGSIQTFLFFDQDFTEIPRPTARAKYTGNTLYVHFQQLISAALVDVARNQQVSSALRRFKPQTGGAAPARPQVVSIGRKSPALSEAGFATSAFLLRELREIDYLAGILDGHSSSPHETWVSRHADVQLLRRFYDSPLGPTLDATALAALVDTCRTQPSVLALGQAAWGRRCLLAGAARLSVQELKSICGDSSTSDKCEKASEFSALGKAAKELQATQKTWQFEEGIGKDIDHQLSLLGDRIDEMVRNQPSRLALPSRALDMALESLFIDGLQFQPNTFSDEKDRRVMRGRKNTVAWGLLTDLRLVVDRSFWALEASRRFNPWVAAAFAPGGVEMGWGFVPALSLGAGIGCSNHGAFTWFTCTPQPERLADGSFRATDSFHSFLVHGSLSAEVLVLRPHPVLSFHMGPLVTARSKPFGGGGRTLGVEAGGFLRLGLARWISLDFRVVTGLPVGVGTGTAKPVGSPDLIFAAGWQY